MHSIYHPLFEVGVFAVLHFDNDFLAAFRLTENVVDGRAVAVIDGWLLLVEELQIGDGALTLKQRIQEVKQVRLGEILTEDDLETDVRERINELSHNRIAFNCSCKDRAFS